jgi:hypothetical protein
VSSAIVALASRGARRVLAELKGVWSWLSEGWRRYGWWLFFSVAAAAVLYVFGLTKVDGFAGDMIAGWVGILASIPITIFVIEKILDRRRHEEWVRVRHQSARMIEGLVQEAAGDLQLALNDEQKKKIPSPFVLPARGHAPALRKIAEALREREGDEDLAVERLYRRLQPTLYHLIDRMSARVYMSNDPTLSERFGALEVQTRAWERIFYLYDGGQGVPVGALWSPAADTADAMAALVEYAQSALPAPPDPSTFKEVSIPIVLPGMTGSPTAGDEDDHTAPPPTSSA